MGFRIDAVPHLFEDEQLRDEPPSDNIHTQNQPETYELIKYFRRFLDQYGERRRKMIFLTTEAYSSHDATMRYYGDTREPGAHFPFNFLLLTDLNAETSAQILNNTISNYLTSLDKTKMPNWVSGNHDWPRIPTRMGASSAVDTLNALSLLLPGTATVYMGDEIGMDSYWNLDRQQCPPGVRDDWRTPARTPFHWTSEKNAGFTKAESKPWIPINPESYHVNVASEREMASLGLSTHLSNFKKLMNMKKLFPSYKSSTTETYVISDQVLAIKRQHFHQAVFHVILVNLGKTYSGKLNLKKAIAKLATSVIYYVPMTSVNTRIENCDDPDATSCDVDVENIELAPKSVVVLKFFNHGHKNGTTNRKRGCSGYSDREPVSPSPSTSPSTSPYVMPPARRRIRSFSSMIGLPMS